MKYDAEVKSAIARVNPAIDPALVHAIIQKESSHGATLVTAETQGRYSYGPMMVLDTTATSMFGVADPATLKEPATGIYYGVRYLDDKLGQYPTDVNAAIAAYNSGTAHRAAGGGFTNQSYVDKVNGFWRQYRLLAPVSASAGLLLALAGAVWLYLRARRGSR